MQRPYMDEAGIEAKGLAPLGRFLSGIDAIGDRRTLTARVCRDVRADVDPLNATTAFDVSAGQRLFLAPEDRVRVW